MPSLDSLVQYTTHRSVNPGLPVLSREKLVNWLATKYNTPLTLKGFNLYVEHYAKRHKKYDPKTRKFKESGLFPTIPNKGGYRYLRRKYILVSLEGIEFISQLITDINQNPSVIEGFEQKAIERETKLIISRLRSKALD